MQHPDEGVIHSWLDGALSAEESTDVESHIAQCEQCRTAVAEARGFIAASSRILTALDDVPRGVIPAVPARKRDLRVFWRAAAAMLVVAGGSLVVLRDGGQDTAVTLSTTDSVASLESVTSDAAANSPVLEGAAVADGANAPPQQAEMVAPSTRRPAPPATGSDLSKAAPGNAVTNEADFSAKTVAGRTSAVVGGTGATVVPDTTAPAGGTLASVSGPSARAEVALLRVVSSDPVIGGSRTVYQVATDTVTLTESEPIALRGIVTTGVREQRARGARAVSPMTAQAAAAPPPAPPLADSQLSRDAATRSMETAATAGTTMLTQAVPPVAVQFKSISWIEHATGKRLTLSGNLPVERLQEIRLSIEKERAASRTKAP